MGLNRLHPSFDPWARWIYGVARRHNLRPRVTSDYRSMAEQRRLYIRRAQGKHPFPVAPPGCSQHNYGFARDMVSDNNPWLGLVWEAFGGKYGGRRDPVHFGVTWTPC